MKLLSLITLLFCVSCMEAADNPIPKEVVKREPVLEEDNANDTFKPENTKAQAFRIKGKGQISYFKMTQNIAKDEEDSYRSVPKQDKDNDENITKSFDLGEVECGTAAELKNVSERASDCETKFTKEKTFWNGLTNGISGEGNFIVVMNKDSKTIWKDETTGLLWSHNIGQDTWAAASGNFGDNETEDFICNKIAGFGEDEVSWRLPTRSEFLQADINGARFVLPDTNRIYWTASSVDDGGTIWAINQKFGILEKKDETETLSIRCIGHVIK